MAQSEDDREVVEHPAQTQYIFAHAETREVLRHYVEETFTPVPEPGSRVIVADTHATPNEENDGGWEAQEQEYDAIVVTNVEYEFNRVLFEGQNDSARRLLTKVWIFGSPIETAPETE